MDSTYIIGIILVATIVIPILLLNHNKNKKNAIVKKKFADMTKSTIIANQESWNGYLIALDKTNRKCYYVHHHDKICQSQILDLTNFTSCRVVSGNSMNDSSSATNIVELVFIPKDKETKSIALQFFNADTDGFTLNGELQCAERWKKLCSECIK